MSKKLIVGVLASAALAVVPAIAHADGVRGASGTSTATAPAAEGPCPYSGSHGYLFRYDEGPAVEHAQCLINLYGYGINRDGVFGGETYSAVRDVQRRCSLPQDGVIGPNTWNCLHPDKLPNPR